MSLISAISSRGHMRFTIEEKGGVDAAVFIEFLKRLIAGAGTHNLSDRRSRRGSSREESQRIRANTGREIALVLSPALLAGSQPRRVGVETLKADTLGRMAITGREDFTKEGSPPDARSAK
jgi:hypothetical protein